LKKEAMIDALVRTGAYLQQHAHPGAVQSGAPDQRFSDHAERLGEAIRTEHAHNGFFTEKFVRQSLGAIAGSLEKWQLQQWMDRYPRLPAEPGKAKTIGVVMAGNIPLVGFHDLLSVIMSGNIFLGKPSSKDDRLLRLVAEAICLFEPAFSERIGFTDEYLNDAAAFIATGSNNSARYFEYYFKDKPHIIRKNRNGVAVLSGRETNEELRLLGEDIFTYFGLGCRNVTKIFIPEGFAPERLMEVFESFGWLQEHHKYNNNLEYNRSVYLMNRIHFYDNGVLLLKEANEIASPVGVVYYEKYSQIEDLKKIIAERQEEIQCVVSTMEEIENRVPPGTSQSPALWDYADGVDTMKFLTEVTMNNGI
jgi:hypothetical protein